MINHLHQQKNWQTQISEAVSDIDELLDILNLSHLKDKFYQPAVFPVRIPHAFINKMKVGDATDPLFLQVVPDKRALKKVTGYVSDPLAEAEHNPNKGILHKYKSRVLLTVTGACAVHCRYCFRQHFDYQANMPKTPSNQLQSNVSNSQIGEVATYIKSHPEVNEVLFSGGDPLSLSNRRLGQWLEQLSNLPQIKIVRFHTRLPIIIPERIDDELLTLFNKYDERFNLVMVVHTNHANEIDENTTRHLYKLKQSGVTLLNQAVLLSNINDDVESQVQLSHKLFHAGVLPYYLHVLDKVDGAAYFDMTEEKAVTLYWKMLAELPGYLMPKLTREVADEPYKVPVNLY